MLKDQTTYAVLPARDLDRARAFYSEKLGLEPTVQRDGEMIFSLPSGSKFEMYKTENAGTAKNTQLCWATDNLEEEMKQLRDKGVQFEEYDQPGLKTENGIADLGPERAAWFLDSEGNILSIAEGLPK